MNYITAEGVWNYKELVFSVLPASKFFELQSSLIWRVSILVAQARIPKEEKRSHIRNKGHGEVSFWRSLLCKSLARLFVSEAITKSEHFSCDQVVSMQNKNSLGKKKNLLWWQDTDDFTSGCLQKLCNANWLCHYKIRDADSVHLEFR